MKLEGISDSWALRYRKPSYSHAETTCGGRCIANGTAIEKIHNRKYVTAQSRMDMKDGSDGYHGIRSTSVLFLAAVFQVFKTTVMINYSHLRRNLQGGTLFNFLLEEPIVTSDGRQERKTNQLRSQLLRN